MTNLKAFNIELSKMKKKDIYTEEERYWMAGGNTGMLPTRITPSEIHELKPNEIFVFGSNVMGMHHGGAARYAYNNFGAEWGNGEGLQGKSYAIPTMEGLTDLAKAVSRFYDFAKEHNELIFLITPIGCGIAGYIPDDIAPLFKDSAHLENVYLPLSFWKVIMKSD